jgi:5-dehydro-2-deoxygluconokinase
VARPIELPGSLAASISSSASSLGAAWSNGRWITASRCLCFYHPDDDAALKARQERELLRLHDAAHRVGRELLIEIIAGKHGPIDDDTVARVLARLYEIGVKPDWWKLEGQASAKAWAAVAATIDANDPLCRGIMLLGLEAPEAELAQAFRVARTSPRVRGFAIGRTICVEPARKGSPARSTTRRRPRQSAESFARLCALWQDAAPGGAP